MEPASEQAAPSESLSFEALADLALRRDQVPLRLPAMRLLAERVLREPGYLALLAKSLREQNPSVRRRAAQTLGYCGTAAQAVLGELCESMRTDPIWTVREAAVHAVSAISWPALEEYRSAEVPMQLLEVALTDREPLVRDAAIEGLAACMADERVSGEVSLKIEVQLANTMKHPHASRRCRAVTAVCRLSQEEGWGGFAIHRGLRDSHWKVRRTTVQALGENPITAIWLPPEIVLPELMKRVFDQHPVVKTASRETLGQLMAALPDRALAKLLASLTLKPSAIETLLTALQDFQLSPQHECRFFDLCRRRADWHLQNLSDQATLAPKAGLDDIVRQVLSLAAKWQVSAKQMAQDPASAKQSAEEKEAAWLLARWVEIFLGGESSYSGMNKLVQVNPLA